MVNCSRPIAVGALGVLLAAATTAPAQSNEFRAMWIDAWGTGFLNASEASQLVADARAYNFNALVVQMRRRGDAFYNNLVAGNDPKTTAIASGFDALQDVITKAHDTSGGKKRLEVHCWVTTHVIWSSTTPPSQAGHVFNSHREYLTKNSTGTNWISEGYYLDPGHPSATMWNFVMATNIVRRYDVDGFHWDYIRYPTTDSGYNDTAIARYNAEFGLSGQPSYNDTQFSNWRRRQVTDFLRWVNSEMLSIRTNLVISCAVFGSRSDAYNARFQDWAAWNSEGIIDICMPMGYTSDNTGVFIPRVDDAYSHQGVRRVYNGQGAYLNTKENTVWQLDYIRNKPLYGSVLYSYRTPNSGTPDIPGTLSYIKTNHQPTWVDVPAIPWKATPTKAIVRGTVKRQDTGAVVYNASVTINTSLARTNKTEPHGAFAFFETPPGTYTITATATDLGVATTNVTLSAGTNRTMVLVLPPDSTPPIISGVGTSNLTDTSVIIKWLTDENANSVAEYGTNVSYGTTVSNATMLLNHAVSLNNLTPATLYHYRVRSRNTTGLQTNSADFTFTSNPPGVVNDVIVESRLSDGSLNSNPLYTDTSFSDSTLKSSAAGLVGTGSRYAVSGTPNYTVKPTLAAAGGTYDVYLTHGSAGSISDDIVAAVTQTSCSGLPATTTIFREPGGNTWEHLGQMALNSGVTVPTLKFTYFSGTLDGNGNGRMYSDSIKFVFVTPPQPPMITNQPPDRAVNQGANATFTVGATGAAPLSYQWRFEGTNIAAATASSYTRTNAQPAHEGDYDAVVTNVAGSVTSSPAFLIVAIPPSMAMQPQSQSVNQDDDAMFAVTADGTDPLAYQWRLNGTNLAGAGADTFTVTNAQPANAGSYSVVVTNNAGSVTSAVATLAVNIPPSIQIHPGSQTVTQGGNATFSVIASGTPPLGYQWRLNGTNLSGGSASAYTVTNAQPANAGGYSVVVTNSAGSATSAVAALTVNIPPSITGQPQNQTAGLGVNVSFAVTASGTAPLSYQWRFNGTNLAGATASDFSLLNVQTADGGSYAVVVTNVAGAVTSANAVLTVRLLRFDSIRLLTDGRIQLVLKGEPGDRCFVDESSNLVNWIELTNFINTDGTTEFTDESGTNLRRRFYRARQ